MKYLFAILMIFMLGCTSYTVTEVPEQPAQNNVVEANTVTFVVTGVNFKFFRDGVEAPELRVKQGTKVRIEFESTDGFHDWVVDEFNAATERVDTGGSTFVEFTADEKGTFEYYCSVGSHRAQGMFGNLIVE